MGAAGALVRFRVAVEDAVRGVEPAGFAAAADAAFGDRRGWIAGGRWRLRRVGAAAPSEFTLYLVTPVTRAVLCGDGPDRYTTCRRGSMVVVNVARWANAVPGYGAGLDIYRAYAVNHEVGHFLGHGHQLCPAPGRPAPVMQQQTLGLHGCTANPWPYLEGHLHSGPAGVYGDAIPDEEPPVSTGPMSPR